MSTCLTPSVLDNADDMITTISNVLTNVESNTPAQYDISKTSVVTFYGACDNGSYLEAINRLHESLLLADVTFYYNAQIALPRPLQGLRTAAAIFKLAELDPNLYEDDRSTLMVDVVGNRLVLTTFKEKS